ncbi:MAG TPA: cytochrome b/b6 domain-containing protein [Mucilaginibacter sp.]|jgi:cytochrome b|nr:cytochrome b/b6 domain-containing protein [Mucilaginibacter sp.]
MAVPETVASDVQKQAVKKNSASIRLWHWLNALVISGSLLTVLLNSTLLKTRKNAQLIQDQLKEAGATVTNDQARHAAHELSDQVWALHTWFGYGLAALVAFRLLLEFFQLADQKFIRTLKSAYQRYRTIQQNRGQARHDFWVKTLYALFYLMIIAQVITGLCLAFEDDVPALKAIHAFREIHSFNMYLILGFITLHLGGVFLAERRDKQGIVSDMINGGRG